MSTAREGSGSAPGRRRRSRRPRLLLAGVAAVAALLTLASCRDFPFEAREPSYGFVGDYETGDTTQWDEANYVEELEPERIEVVTEPVRQGRYAGRFEVRPGDKADAGNEFNDESSGERAEVSRHFSGQEGEGDEFFYSVSMFLPEDWIQEQEGWRVPLQFHSVNDQLNGRSPVPPLALDFLPPDGRDNGKDDGGLFLELHGGDVTEDGSAEHNNALILPLPVQTGVWHDFILQVKWEPDDGEAKVWHRVAGQDDDFTLRAELSDVPTLLYVTEPEASVSDVFMRQGLYRADNDDDQTNVLYMDAMRRGDSFDDMVEAFDPPR